MKQKEADPFYATGAWKAARREALLRDRGQCVLCRRAGRRTLDRHGKAWPVPATMVHHIKPYQTHPELALDLDNLMSLCDRCHWDVHPEKHREAAKEPPAAITMGIRVENPNAGREEEDERG
ncbi:MAG: HNH endonuclease [Clostridia bacterium]|nr:HNH endonuclease [Clostridia bacterium]